MNCAFHALLTDLKACIASKNLQWGRTIHAKVLETLQDSDTSVMTSLIKLYADCGRISDARNVFECIAQPDAVSWNVLFFGYAEDGDGRAALDLFSKMKTLGYVPSSITFVAVVKACTCLAMNSNGLPKFACLERGREIHSEIGCYLNPYVQNALIDMYAKCGSMREAQCIFDGIQIPNVVSWNTLLMGYVDNGEGSIALELFSRMKTSSCIPNSITYVAALKACTTMAESIEETKKGDCLERGRAIHSEIGHNLDRYVQCTLIDMYCRCCSMVDARCVFDDIAKPDVMSWNALLHGYVENGEGHLALRLFSNMKASSCIPNNITYIACIKACVLTGALALGRMFHSEIREFSATQVVTCLIDLYAKCGSITEAREVFDSHSKVRGISTWNAMLAGYSTFGRADSAFNLFKEMQDERFKPDAVTFLSMLLCCTHAGLVEKAREYFEAMIVKYEVKPTINHYTCMVDVLGRANQLNEAIKVLLKMPCKPDSVIWTALLDACCKWKNIEIARMAFQSLVAVEGKTAVSAHVLMLRTFSKELQDYSLYRARRCKK